MMYLEYTSVFKIREMEIFSNGEGSFLSAMMRFHRRHYVVVLSVQLFVTFGNNCV